MEVKDKILKIARDEFAKNGFKNVRTDDLAQKLGISKRTLYEHFESKEQLFEAVIDVELERINFIVSEVVRRIESDPDANLIDEVKKIWQINVESALGFTNTFFDDIQRFTPHLWEKISSFRQKVMEANVVTVFNIGIKQGVFKKDLTVDVLFLMHNATVQNILNPEVLHRLNLPPRDVIETIYDVMFTGVLTENAREYYYNNCKPFCITK